MDPTVVIAVASAVLGAPFLNFLLSLTRSRVEKDSAIATGAGVTVKAMQEAVDGLRKELGEVRDDLKEARGEIDAQAAAHRRQMDELRAEHRRQIETIRQEAEKEIVRARVEHRREMADLERRLTKNPDPKGPHS